jgi:hypothetical protein
LNLSRQTIHRVLALVQQRLQQRFELLSSMGDAHSEKKTDSV